MKRKLTAKQELWCKEFLVDLNAHQAAIRAGYSKKSARQIGTENLSKPSLMAVVTRGKLNRSERVDVDADWVLKRLALEAEADIADIYNQDGTVKPVHEWPLIWRQGLISGIDVTRLMKEGGPVEITKLKISERVKRVELIGKHVDVSAFAENHRHAGRDGEPLPPAVLEIVYVEPDKGPNETS